MPLWDIEEAARHLGITPDELRALRATKGPPFRRHGKRIRYDSENVIRWEQGYRPEPKPQHGTPLAAKAPPQNRDDLITIIAYAIRHRLHDLSVRDAAAVASNILDRLKDAGVRMRTRRRP